MNILLYSLVLLSLLFISTTALENSCIKTFSVKGKQYTADLTGLFSSNRSVTAQGADGYFYSINPCSSIPQPASSCPGGTFLGYQLSRDLHNCFPIAQGISPTVKSMELIDPDDASGGLLIKMNTVDGTYNRGAEMKIYCKVNTTIVDATVKERKDDLYTSIYVFNVKSGYACLGSVPPPKKGCIKTFNVKDKQYTADLNGLFPSNHPDTVRGGEYVYYINPCSSIPPPAAASCPSDREYSGYQLSDDKQHCYGIAMTSSPTIELMDPANASGGILIKMGTVDGPFHRGAEMKISCKVNTTIVDATVTEMQDGPYGSIYSFSLKSGYACLGGASPPTPPKKGCCCCSCKKK